jgi:rubrerythrin
LQVALSAEQNARKFYRALGEITPETKLRRLYMELAEFEADHVEYLEKKLEESPTKGPASSQ